MGKAIYFIISVLVVGVFSQADVTTTTSPESPVTTPDTLTSPTTTPVPTTAPPTTTPPTTTPPTTTSTPTTTSPAPPTTTPASILDEYYRVTEDNVTCVMYGGDVSLSVTYQQTSGKVATGKVKIPQPEDKVDVKSIGSCNGTAGGYQYIQVTWGPTNERSKFELLFNLTGSKWMLVHTDADIYIDEKTFPNATDAGHFLHVTGKLPGLTYVAVDTNSSLICRAAVDSSNFTGKVENSSNSYVVTATAVGFKMQAYNFIPYTTRLQEGSRCEADLTSDLVPIAVGCALAGLVLLVLISYLVGRRRRAASYQSV